MSARDRRRAFAFGSFARNGLIGVRAESGGWLTNDDGPAGGEIGAAAGGAAAGAEFAGGALIGARAVLGGINGGSCAALDGRTAAIGPVPDGRTVNGGRAGGDAGPLGAWRIIGGADAGGVSGRATRFSGAAIGATEAGVGAEAETGNSWRLESPPRQRGGAGSS
jgi:hypothetical protein